VTLEHTRDRGTGAAVVGWRMTGGVSSTLVLASCRYPLRAEASSRREREFTEKPSGGDHGLRR